MIDKALVIYHANCDDGFGAALAFWKIMAPTYSHVNYHPGVYGEEPPPVNKETSVWILDFSYAPEVMVDLAHKAGNVQVLDHHKSAMEKWMAFEDKHGGGPDDPNNIIPSNLNIEFDMSRSGAMMTYEFLKASSYSMYDKLFNFLQDRDLWKFENPDTQYFTYYLRSQQMTFEVWDTIADNLNYPNHYEWIMDQGLAIKQFFDKQCADIVATNKQHIQIGAWRGLACNCTGQFASDVGNILAKETGTFGATWYTNSKDEAVFSLRSIGEFDVSKIAATFGGGGHKNAAGFKLPANSWPYENNIITEKL